MYTLLDDFAGWVKSRRRAPVEGALHGREPEPAVGD
jgi:hypothetical protein